MKGALLYLFDFFMGKCDIVTVAVMFFSVFVIIFLCFPIHECAHAFAAKLLGDDTAERQGRITLNPLAHVDPMGALCMCICCIGWAKPTPVELRNCRKVSVRTANVIVSIAGPLSNVLLALVVMIIRKIIIVTAGVPIADALAGGNIDSDAMVIGGRVFGATLYYVLAGLGQIIQINTFLAIFNLLPIPPFDGYHVLASFLPAKALYFMEKNGQIIHLIVFVLLISGVLDIPLTVGSSAVIWFLDLITRFIC